MTKPGDKSDALQAFSAVFQQRTYNIHTQIAHLITITYFFNHGGKHANLLNMVK